jgi:hypothetical protein
MGIAVCYSFSMKMKKYVNYVNGKYINFWWNVKLFNVYGKTKNSKNFHFFFFHYKSKIIITRILKFLLKPRLLF